MTPVVMLTHNLLALTREAVRSVLAQDVPTHLVVVDNNSTDGTREWLRTLDPARVTVMALAENVGVSAAWNLALRWLFDTRREPAVLVVNSDVVLRPDTVRLLLADGGLFVTAVGVSTRNEIEGDVTLSRRPHPDFSAYLIRHQCWMRVGEFDERMFAWHSDNDYHVRMTRAGVWAGTCGVPFYHVAAATVKASEQDKDARARWRDVFERDRAEFLRKWGVEPGTKEYERMTTLAATEAEEGPSSRPAAAVSAGTAAAVPAPSPEPPLTVA